MLKKIVLRLTMASLAIMGLSGIASATPISCEVGAYSLFSKVEGASACERLAVGKQSANDKEDLVNAEGFFDITTWKIDGKYDNIGRATGSDGSSLFKFTGGSQSGTFSFMGDATKPLDIMLIFKSGNNTNLVAYLLDDPYGAGLKYSSPFIKGVFAVNNPKDISHISVYTSARAVEEAAGHTDVPEPGTLALLGLGMAGIMLGAKRR